MIVSWYILAVLVLHFVKVHSTRDDGRGYFLSYCGCFFICMHMLFDFSF